MSNFELVPVENKKQWNDFYGLPSKLYKDDPYYVPQLRVIVEKTLNPKTNPFYNHAESKAFLVYEGSTPVARVVATLDHDYEKYHSERPCHFGYFESIDHEQPLKLLMDAVGEWGKSKGCTTMMGPFNPNMNNECGLLIEGFDHSPLIMTSYNKNYYQKLIEGAGFQLHKKMHAFFFTPQPFPESLKKHAIRTKKKLNCVIRPINPKKMAEEIYQIVAMTNACMQDHWGYVPMREEEIAYASKNLKMILEPEFLLIAEINGKAAGYLLALPDINQAFKKLSSDKLTPLNLIKLIWYLKGPSRNKVINRVRFATLGILPEHKYDGLGPLLYLDIKERKDKRFETAEGSWVMEESTGSKNVHAKFGADPYKTYGIFRKDI